MEFQKITKRWKGYIVGDFSYKWYLKQLKGKKHLIVGNHDHKLLQNEKAMCYFETATSIANIVDNGKRLCICHYPIAEWDGFYRGRLHIYAHIHNKTDGAYQHMSKFENALNAGCMINNYIPVTLKALIQNNNIFKQLNM